MKFLVTWLICFGFFVSSAYGGVYYVAQNSKGKGDGTTFADRMSVATHNAAKFNPGDIIILCGGEITSQVSAPSSGNAGAPITYTNDSKNPSILKVYSSSGAIRIANKNYIVIDGLDIREGRIGIAVFNGAYNTIKNCYIYDMDQKGIHAKGSGSEKKVRYLTIGGAPGEGNEVYNVGQDTGGGDYAFEWVEDVIISYNKGIGNPKGKGTDGIVAVMGEKMLIEYNFFADHAAPYPVGEDGIDLKGVRDAIIRYNITRNNRAGGIKINFNKPTNSYCERIIVYHNLSYNNAYNFNASGNDVGEAHSDIYVWGNVFHSPRSGHNAFINSKGKNFHVYNNTFFGTVADRAGLLVGGGRDYYIKNNIFLGKENPRMIWATSSTDRYEIENNLYFFERDTAQIYWNSEWTSATAVDIKGKEYDPVFLDLNEYNFGLKTNSSALHSGVFISGIPPSITVFGVTYEFSYDELLCSTTDWSNFPPTINTVKQKNQNGQWAIGAYGIKTLIDRPKNVGVLKN